MRWFEFIKVRSSADHARELLELLPATARELAAEPGVTDCAVLRHGLYDGDVAVVLMYYEEEGKVRRTHAGARLAESLRSHGYVDHQVWSLAYPENVPPAPDLRGQSREEAGATAPADGRLTEERVQ